MFTSTKINLFSFVDKHRNYRLNKKKVPPEFWSFMKFMAIFFVDYAVAMSINSLQSKEFPFFFCMSFAPLQSFIENGTSVNKKSTKWTRFVLKKNIFVWLILHDILFDPRIKRESSKIHHIFYLI